MISEGVSGGTVPSCHQAAGGLHVVVAICVLLRLGVLLVLVQQRLTAEPCSVADLSRSCKFATADSISVFCVQNSNMRMVSASPSLVVILHPATTNFLTILLWLVGRSKPSRRPTTTLVAAVTSFFKVCVASMKSIKEMGSFLAFFTEAAPGDPRRRCLLPFGSRSRRRGPSRAGSRAWPSTPPQQVVAARFRAGESE